MAFAAAGPSDFGWWGVLASLLIAVSPQLFKLLVDAIRNYHRSVEALRDMKAERDQLKVHVVRLLWTLDAQEKQIAELKSVVSHLGGGEVADDDRD